MDHSTPTTMIGLPLARQGDLGHRAARLTAERERLIAVHLADCCESHYP
jgi:hypothetical protein